MSAKLLGNRPQPLGVGLVLRSGVGRLELGRASHVQEPARADVLAADDVVADGGVQHRQRPLRGRLSEHGVGDFHHAHPDARPHLPGAAKLQVGVRVAGVAGDADYVRVGLTQPPLELVGKEEIRQFRPAVGRPLPVVPLRLQVGKVHLAGGVCLRRLRDDSALALAGSELGQELPRQREVTEVVHAELHLEAVGRLLSRDGHHAGVVTEHVDAVVGLTDVLGEGRDAVEVGQVTHVDVERAAADGPADIRRGRLAALRAPTRHHDRRARLGERLRPLVAEAAVGPGDDHRLSVHRRHLVGGPA